MKSKPINVGVGIALCILSVAIYLYANQYAGRGFSSYGPDFFPKTLSVLMFLASFMMIVQAFVSKEPDELESIDRAGFIRAVVTLFIAIAYIYGMLYLGFYLATALFLFVVILYLGQRNLLLNAVTSVAVASAIYGIFRFFLKIPLPEGIFERVL